MFGRLILAANQCRLAMDTTAITDNRGMVEHESVGHESVEHAMRMAALEEHFDSMVVLDKQARSRPEISQLVIKCAYSGQLTDLYSAEDIQLAAHQYEVQSNMTMIQHRVQDDHNMAQSSKHGAQSNPHESSQVQCLLSLYDAPMIVRFAYGNPGLARPVQFIPLGGIPGYPGESQPTPHYYQNVHEAEMAVAMWRWLTRVVGYPAESIAILTSYIGQRDLIKDLLSLRASHDTNTEAMQNDSKPIEVKTDSMAIDARNDCIAVDAQQYDTMAIDSQQSDSKSTDAKTNSMAIEAQDDHQGSPMSISRNVPSVGQAIVSTIDRFQGNQADIVIVSLVRTQANSMGHMRDPRRLTVALSRARLGLYVLGRAEVFGSVLVGQLGMPCGPLEVVPGQRYGQAIPLLMRQGGERQVLTFSSVIGFGQFVEQQINGVT